MGTKGEGREKAKIDCNFLYYSWGEQVSMCGLMQGYRCKGEKCILIRILEATTEKREKA